MLKTSKFLFVVIRIYWDSLFLLTVIRAKENEIKQKLLDRKLQEGALEQV